MNIIAFTQFQIQCKPILPYAVQHMILIGKFILKRHRQTVLRLKTAKCLLCHNVISFNDLYTCTLHILFVIPRKKWRFG